MNKSTNIFILVLIFCLFSFIIITYSNNFISSVTEFFDNNLENNEIDNKNNENNKNNKNKNNENIQNDNSFLNNLNNANNEVNQDQSTFPIGGIDINETCPHYDGQYYSFDNKCRPCAAGEFIDYKNKKCVLCPKDTFSENRNSLSCKPCPYGKVTNNLIGQSKCNQPYSTTQQLRKLVGKNHSITLDRVKQQKMQNIEIDSIKRNINDMMESIDSIKYSVDSTNLNQHKQNLDKIKAAEVGINK